MIHTMRYVLFVLMCNSNFLKLQNHTWNSLSFSSLFYKHTEKVSNLPNIMLELKSESLIPKGTLSTTPNV